jgi:hypothetical protein
MCVCMCVEVECDAHVGIERWVLVLVTMATSLGLSQPHRKGLSSNPIFSLTSTFYSAIRLSEPFGTVGGGRGLNWAPKARLKFGVGVKLCKRI